MVRCDVGCEAFGHLGIKALTLTLGEDLPYCIIQCCPYVLFNSLLLVPYELGTSARTLVYVK